MNNNDGLVGKLILEKRYYGDTFWQKVGTQLQLLSEGGFCCTLAYLSVKGSELVEIQFAPFDVTTQPIVPTFVTQEELMLLQSMRCKKDTPNNTNWGA